MAGTDSAELVDACGDDPSWSCEWVYEQTGSEFWASFAKWLVERPLQIALIVVAAFIASRLLKRAINNFVDRLADASETEYMDELRQSSAGRYVVAGKASVRARARTETVGAVLSSIAGIIVWTIAGFMIIGVFGIQLGPLLAGAGIAGVALGFGAQTAVRDFISGLFMLIEDQFGVGDVIDVGEVTGTVEKLSLRTTTLRDVQGTLWHVPNGEILRVANKSQIWARALLDVEVAYEADLRLAEGVIQKTADDMWEDPEWGGDELLDKPEVWGVESLGASGVVIRLVAKTKPAMQFTVERELRLRIKEALEAAGIDIPYPQRTVWLRNQGDHPVAEAPDPSTVPVAETDPHRSAFPVEGKAGS